MVPADSAIVDDDIPSPKSDSIPLYTFSMTIPSDSGKSTDLLDFESLLVVAAFSDAAL